MSGNNTFAVFVQAVEASFGFLIERGYRKAVPRVDPKTGFYEALFVGQKTAVECLVDLREEDVDCKLCVLKSGKPPRDYAINNVGERVREGVANLLWRRGVRETLFTKVSGKSLREQIPITLGDFAVMMQKYVDLLADDDSVLR